MFQPRSFFGKISKFFFRTSRLYQILVKEGSKLMLVPGMDCSFNGPGRRVIKETSKAHIEFCRRLTCSLEQQFSIEGARTPGGCKKGFLGVRAFLLWILISAMVMQKHYIKWCKGCKNDFSIRTGCGLQNELRTAALERRRFGAQDLVLRLGVWMDK